MQMVEACKHNALGIAALIGWKINPSIVWGGSYWDSDFPYGLHVHLL
jgi:hypothetical protein